MKRLSLILLALLAFGQTAWAQDDKTWISGSTTCTLTADSVFTVTPTDGISGAMADYAVENQNYAPWYQDYCSINSVVIGDGVTHVGNQSFYSIYATLIYYTYKSKIKSVTFSDDVESIGDAAFFGCKLQSINIPDHVVTIGTYAFGSCNNASSIHIGDGVTTLGSNAFANCDDVQNLYIGQSVTTLGENCFHWSCYDADIECHAAPFSTWVSSDDDFTASAANKGRFHVAFADYSAWKAAYPSTGCVIIPDLDTEIHWTSGNCALDLDGYGTLTISGNGAMADYTATTDCPWNNADIISKVNRVIVEDGVTTLSNNGFTGFTHVTDVVFLCDMLTAWPSCATDFANTTKCYVSYEWTGHYTNALAQLFFTCGYGMDWNLEINGTLTISKTLPGSGLFYDFQNAEQLPWHDHVSEISDVVIGDSVRNIGSYVFSGIHASTIAIAESVTHIKGHAFDGSTTQFFTVPTSVTQIDAYAFANSGLYTFEIPSFMTQIPEGLFQGCGDLTRVTFNEGITSIGKNAFYNAGLTEVDLPSTLTTIGENVFANTSFAEITFPASLTTIDANAFNGCTDVTDISCYVLNPNTLTWTSSATDFSRQTNFHVVTGTASQWQAKFPDALVNFVEDTYNPEHPYEIYTNNDWKKFCDMVKNVSTQINAKLMADVNIGNLSNTVGTGSKKYSGTFDGNGHTLTFNTNQEDAITRAPFLNIEGAHIKNLHTAGYLRTGYINSGNIMIPHPIYGAQHCSGLVSHVSGSGNQINNCQVSITLDIYHPSRGSTNGSMNSDGDDFCGGLVGEIVSDAELAISNCLFDGIIQYLESQSQNTVPKPTNCGGFVGHNKGTVTICNSLFNPTNITFTGGDGNKTFVHNDGGTTNLLGGCCYTRTLGDSQGTNASSWSPWHIASELGSGWTINSDVLAVPVMTTHTLEGEGTEGNPYQIADADDWAYLARMVNSDIDITSGNYFRMTDDISTIIPMGCYAVNHPFRGHFNGDGYTLNVVINYNDTYAAPFGCISGATIEDLVVTGTVRGNAYSAGLVGTVAAGSSDNYIRDCKVSTAVTTTGNYAGGVMGYGYNVSNHIIGCRFDGSITKAVGTGSYAGALMGWCDDKDEQEVRSCFVTGTLSNFDHMGMNYQSSGTKCFGGTNCYHLFDPDYYNEAPHAYSITSGTQGMTIAYQESIPSYAYNPVSGINFYSHGMTVGGVLYGGPGESFCLALTAPAGFTYSNPMANGTAITPGHSGELYGYNVAINSSSPADVVVTATLTLNGDPIHEINTVDDWNLFAYTVSGGCHNYSGETVNLNADLSVTEMVGISESNSFQGTFNGNGHTLTFNANTSERLCAPFRWIKNATIQHLYTTGTINTSNQMAAGIVGRAYDNCTINDCRSSMEIISSINGDGTHGGFVAVVNLGSSSVSLLSIADCLFDGKLISTNGTTNCGGFVGYSHSNIVQFWNCLFDPTEVTASMGAATFGRSADVSTYYQFDRAMYFTAFGTAQGNQARSISAGENVTIEFSNNCYVNNVSGITSYTWGLIYNNVRYAGSGDQVHLNLTVPTGYVITMATYTPEGGTATEIVPVEGVYSFTMPDANVTINATLIVTLTLEVEGYGNSTESDRWVFIASPVSGSIAPTTVDGLVPRNANGVPVLDSIDYDLYRLNPSNSRWENWKAHEGNAAPNFSLENGRGYLYANKSDVILTFAGTPITTTEQNMPVSQGWNLVGNPFNAAATINVPYYKMNDDGDDIEAVSEYTSTSIPVCTGVVVQASSDGTVTFTKSGAKSGGAKSDSKGSLVLSLVGHDKAIVSFNEGTQLGKFIFNENHAKLYIPQDGEDYAIAYSEGQGEKPLNFKAKENGEYTITVNPEGVEMAYLHLIDNLTGADIDLLALRQAQGPASYTFTAKTTDYESRFKLVFSVEDGPSTGSGAFAFYSNGNWIISNEGRATLQVIDVNGRILSSEEINGSVSKAISGAAGVYMIRLVNGEDVKVQKIVVR